MTRRTCSEPGCTRPVYAGDLCQAHDRRLRVGSKLAGPVITPEIVVGDDTFIPCPDTTLALADACAELDARAIVRLLWPHFLEAHLAGLEPFTLDAAS